MAEQLNILHIMCDQLTASALRSYGNQVCRTPHIDTLVERGTLFENHYCNFPLCAPSRASMLAGRLATRLEVYDNACEFAAHTPTIPYYLTSLGYHTCLSGKMHFVGPDQLHGYQERLTTDIYPSDFGWTPDWTQAIPSAATGLNLRSVVEAGICRRSLQLDYDDEVCAKAVQWLYDYGRMPESKPFFCTVSFTHPHNPYVITEPYWNLYDDDEIDSPRVAPIPPEQLDPHSLRLWKIYKFGQYVVGCDDIRRARHAYYSMISYVDDQVGKLLAALDTMDLGQRTVVIFSSDHGDMLGERGLWYKWMHFEGAVRIPLIISIPGQKPSRVTEPVSLLDLLPTLMDIGVSPQRYVDSVSDMEGVSLLPAVLGREKLPFDRPIFGEMTAEGAINPSLMLRKGKWKYIESEGDPPLLFDLDKIPDELDNLSGTPEVQSIERNLRELIAANWQVRELKTKMIASAQHRRFVQETRLSSNATPWDYEPRKDVSKQYVRSGGAVSATIVKGRARYPYVAPKAPDHPDSE